MHIVVVDKKIYSVDMMFAYINLYKPKYISVPLDQLLHELDGRCWGDPSKNIYYSPMDVLKNPKSKKYSKEIERINKADLRYSIIMDKNYIVDGMHRLTKAYLLGKKKLKVYQLNPVMNKFLIDKNKNWKKVDNISLYEYLILFHKRFCKNNPHL